MKTIKIGRQTYDIQKGDYILDNGAYYQFCAGNKRTLKAEGWSSYSYLKIPKVRLKEIPFDKMKKVITGSNKHRDLLIKWYF